jgi:hypothetical protein
MTAPITHTYALVQARYVPTVTLQDASHNQTTVDLNAVVVDDTVAPVGTFTVAPAAAWANLTKVTLTQTALSDNWSPAADIARTVDWGDGSTPQTWTTGTTLTHVYSAAGDFTPAVTITDEALNSAVVSTTLVNAKVDATAPVVKLTLPRRHTTSVRSWKTLRGKATDSHGTGVKSVSLRAVEKRGKVWYGYNATTKKWVKARTKIQAFSHTQPFTLKTTSTHTWAASLVKLTKGTLVYKVRATDLVKNTSAWVSHTATLTRR